MVSTAIRLATSPEACPPMPSATMASRSCLGQVERVLVVLALHPDVGFAGEADPQTVEREGGAHRQGHRSVGHRRINAVTAGGRSRTAGPQAHLEGRRRRGRGRRRWCRRCIPGGVGVDLQAATRRRCRRVRAPRRGPRCTGTRSRRQRHRPAVDGQHREALGILVGAVVQLEAQAHLAHGGGAHAGQAAPGQSAAVDQHPAFEAAERSSRRSARRPAPR